jgi:hypothetical protein
MIPAIKQIFKKIKQIIITIAKGITGIAAEIGYALAIMLAAFLISVLVVASF